MVHGRGLGEGPRHEDLARLAVDVEDPGVVTAYDLVGYLWVDRRGRRACG